MHQVLQSVTEVYYKVRQVLQSAAKSVWSSDNSLENWCYCAKVRAFKKKNSFTEGFFVPSKSKTSKKKENLQDKGSDTKFSY